MERGERTRIDRVTTKTKATRRVVLFVCFIVGFFDRHDHDVVTCRERDPIESIGGETVKADEKQTNKQTKDDRSNAFDQGERPAGPPTTTTAAIAKKEYLGDRLNIYGYKKNDNKRNNKNTMEKGNSISRRPYRITFEREKKGKIKSINQSTCVTH